MKKPIFRLGNPDAGLEIELARRRALHRVHDAAWILTSGTIQTNETSRCGDNRIPSPGQAGGTKQMQILCEVNQAECFRRGIDAPRSTMKIEVDPAKLPEEIREFLADHLYDGDKLSARDDFQLLRPDLLGFMEAVLTAKEYKEASDHNHTQILFDEWIKGPGKDGEAKREMVAKELVDAQEAHPVTSQEKSVNTPGSIANLTRTLEMLSRKQHEPQS
jgi:hypothetical protein